MLFSLGPRDDDRIQYVFQAPCIVPMGRRDGNR
jgi:hypothetical protein